MSPATRARLVLVLAATVGLVVAVIAMVTVAIDDGGRTSEPGAAPSVSAPSSATPTPPTRAERCRGFSARAAKRSRVVTGQGSRVVVLGDSWAVGRDVPMRRTWPVYLGGEVHVYAFPGAAISRRDVNRCGGVSFADRAPVALARGADLVVVEGGLNDVARTDREIRAGFDALLDRVRGYDVVLLGPPSTPRRVARVARVDALLAELAAEADVPYVPTLDIPLTYLPDGLHPDASGHRRFGTVIAQRLADRGLLEPGPAA